MRGDARMLRAARASAARPRLCDFASCRLFDAARRDATLLRCFAADAYAMRYAMLMPLPR